MARKKSPTIREALTDAIDGAEGAGADAEEVSLVGEFLDDMAKYARAFEKWERRADKVIKRYRDESRELRTTGEAKFNILWSNVQTLVPATFSRLPQPDVSRRFKDQDAVGRVAALLLERGLDFEVSHYNDYRSTLRACVFDRFLGGRGTAWVRYEPHFRTQPGQPDDGAQVTEDIDEAPVNEALDYECAPVDYVHWKDFGHDVARTWEEVTKVWRNVYMSEDAVKERFGEDVAKSIPYDSSPEDMRKQDRTQAVTEKKQARIIELWDKGRGKAYWFSKSLKKMLDERDDPLGLAEFFPCPRPLYATVTNDSLVPVPDFTLYQDQAKELDVLADRIDGLAKMLQVKGVYDASVPELGRLFTEGENGTLIPGANWAAFAEKNGLKGSLQMVDLQPIAEALRMAAETMEQVKGQVYEITGISDIIRGQTSASETATAQQIKGQYASLRLRSMQDEVARFATDLLRLKAQVICGKFAPQTIAAISAAEQLSEEDKALVYVSPDAPVDPMVPPPPPQPMGPAMALLIGQERIADPAAESPNPLRAFRIEVAADTLVQMDEQAEKESRVEFVTAVGAYIEKAAPVIQMTPAAGPLLMELLAFGVRGFKVGKSIEGQFDAAITALKKTAQAGPALDPAAMQEQAMQAAKQQVAQENATKEIALTKRAADLDVREMKFGAEQQLAKAQEDVNRRIEEHNRALEQAKIDDERRRADDEVRRSTERAAFEGEKAEFARSAFDSVQRDTAGRDEALKELVQTIVANDAETKQMMAQLLKTLSADQVIERDPMTGRAVRARRVVQ